MWDGADAAGASMGAVIASSNSIVIVASKTASGICSLNLSGPDLFTSSAPLSHPTVIRFGSWVGGDMDGNPDVHAKILVTP
mgnify:CR=1 FL=1